LRIGAADLMVGLLRTDDFGAALDKAAVVNNKPAIAMVINVRFLHAFIWTPSYDRMLMHHICIAYFQSIS
jgi:hypothetical protein